MNDSSYSIQSFGVPFSNGSGPVYTEHRAFRQEDEYQAMPTLVYVKKAHDVSLNKDEGATPKPRMRASANGLPAQWRERFLLHLELLLWSGS